MPSANTFWSVSSEVKSISIFRQDFVKGQGGKKTLRSWLYAKMLLHTQTMRNDIISSNSPIYKKKELERSIYMLHIMEASSRVKVPIGETVRCSSLTCKGA
jgi:hypothetical protein